jgi:hypothetical protein
MSITDITEGDQKQLFAIRFRGTLISDSQLAFEKLDPAFKQAGTTLLFREENDGHEILGMPGVIQPQASNPLVNVILFLLTLVSMLMAGAMYGMEAPADTSILGILQATLQNLPNGITFAASLLGILMAHEFGHYFAARFHRIAVSLPYFLPFPLSLFGTLGAFIRLKEPPKNRRVLLDIGLSGPIAGLIVAIPVLLIGLYLSDLGRLPLNAMTAQGSVLEGNSLLYLAMKYIVTGEFLPKPLHYIGSATFSSVCPCPTGAPMCYYTRSRGLVGLDCSSRCSTSSLPDNSMVVMQSMSYWERQPKDFGPSSSGCYCCWEPYGRGGTSGLG